MYLVFVPPINFFIYILVYIFRVGEWSCRDSWKDETREVIKKAVRLLSPRTVALDNDFLCPSTTL